jgi:hypothetical protein
MFFVVILKVSTGGVVPEGINLGDSSDEGLEVFRPMMVGPHCDQIVAVKRNLSAAFSECDDVEATTSKSIKFHED